MALQRFAVLKLGSLRLTPHNPHLTPHTPDGGFYSGAFARGQPAAGPGVFSFANGNKQSGQWIAQVRALCRSDAGVHVVHLTSLQKEEGAEEDAPPKLVWISAADASI